MYKIGELGTVLKRSYIKIKNLCQTKEIPHSMMD
jgi:hypothetical protein